MGDKPVHTVDGKKSTTEQRQIVGISASAKGATQQHRAEDELRQVNQALERRVQERTADASRVVEADAITKRNYNAN